MVLIAIAWKLHKEASELTWLSFIANSLWLNAGVQVFSYVRRRAACRVVNKWPNNFHDAGCAPSPPLPKIAFSAGGSGTHLIMVLRAHPSPRHGQHLDPFIRFSTAHDYVQQTDRHRDHVRNIGNNRPHLCTPCMRCGVIIRLLC